MPAHRCSMSRSRLTPRPWSSPPATRSTRSWPRSRERDQRSWWDTRRLSDGLRARGPWVSARVLVAAIAGRRENDFSYCARMVPASAFRYALGTDPSISEYHVQQTSTGADVLVVGSPDVAAVTTALTAALSRQGL